MVPLFLIIENTQPLSALMRDTQNKVLTDAEWGEFLLRHLQSVRVAPDRWKHMACLTTPPNGVTHDAIIVDGGKTKRFPMHDRGGNVRDVFEGWQAVTEETARQFMLV